MDKRKHSSDSGETPEAKTARNGGSPPGDLIGSLRKANEVLLDDSIHELCEHMDLQKVPQKDASNNSNDSEVNITKTNIQSPCTDVLLNREILQFMKKIDNRLQNVETKLTKLDSLEEKVINIDSDVKKLWVYVHDNIKSSDEKINKCMDQIDELQFALGEAKDSITRLSNEQSKFNADMDYLRSQSMRNNLIFGNISEVINEKHSVTEGKVREFMVQELGIQQGVVNRISIERAHRSTQPPDGISKADFTYSMESDDDDDGTRVYGPPRKPRNVFVKFASFKDRELVRNSCGKLKGSCYYVTEQFPKAVNERRKSLIPRLKEAKNNGKSAWISYDTLYIDGVPQSSASAHIVPSRDSYAPNVGYTGSGASASFRGRGGGKRGSQGGNGGKGRVGRGAKGGSGGQGRGRSSNSH